MVICHEWKIWIPAVSGMNQVKISCSDIITLDTPSWFYYFPYLCICFTSVISVYYLFIITYLAGYLVFQAYFSSPWWLNALLSWKCLRNKDEKWTETATVWSPWILCNLEKHSNHLIVMSVMMLPIYILSVPPDIQDKMAPFSLTWKAVVWCLPADC